MFKNQRQGNPLYILHKGNTPFCEVGSIVSVSPPRPENPNFNMYGPQAKIVVDIKAKVGEEIVYIDYDEALTIYGKMIDASDGGFEGVRDEGGIRATLDFVQNDLYYPTFAEKLTYLMYRFCSGHFFNDGNKRIALTLGAYFLHKNNYYWHACICMRTLESIIYHVAASNINQDLLLRIVNSFLTSKDYDEELKIDIANAMSKGELGIQGEDYEKD